MLKLGHVGAAPATAVRVETVTIERCIVVKCEVPDSAQV